MVIYHRSGRADVLVVGGGLAGTWTALGAARAGAQTVLVDKGFCGTSGVTATAGVGHWWVPPEDRAEAIAARLAASAGLGEEAWMARILETTWELLPSIGKAFPFPVGDDRRTRYRTVRGPEYLRAMRRLVQEAGVEVRDHHPALDLLVDGDGVVVGAAGVSRQPVGDWRIEAGAVVVATGGCAFKSGLMGCHNNTGDGHLMAVEAGATLSGMEFSSYYTVAPAGTTMTRSMAYLFGDYVDADGRPLEFASPDRWVQDLARALLRGPVFTSLGRMPTDIQAAMPQVQPNFMLPFDRQGIDPYRDRFEVTLRPEGTIRGTGGLEITDEACATGVPGLFVAGDAASRERVAGATSGGGAQNSAWALSSGTWAGTAAAACARQRSKGPTAAAKAKSASLVRHPGPTNPTDVVTVVQEEMHPLDKNLFRSERKIRASLATLDDLWTHAVPTLQREGPIDRLRAREAASMTAVARWCYRAALAREETRGMHQREDHPTTDPGLTRRIGVGGVDEVIVQMGQPA